MKKHNLLSYISVAVAGLSVAFLASCEGPQGPSGLDGAPGADGTATCIVCHNLETKATIISQYDSSVHGKSQMVAGQILYRYAGAGDSRKACAICHTAQGFQERVETGLDTIAAGLLLPDHIDCEACHDFHQTLDQTNEGPDYALRTKDPVSLIMTNHTTMIDFGNESNLCANCHQPRSAGPTPDANGNAKVTSSHYGGHHGPQSTVVAGIGGYEVAGLTAYPEAESTAHFKSATCVVCHMHNQNHTFEPSLDACKECHDDITSFDYKGVQTEVEGLMEQLKEKLVSKGLLTDAGSAVVGTYPVDQVGALYNFLMIEDERSEGVHNPDYVKALLRNSIEVFN